AALQKRILGKRQPLTERPGALMPPADFAAARKELERHLKREVTDQEVVSHLLYPRVFSQFAEHQERYSDTGVLPTPVFFYGMKPGEEMNFDIEPGKTFIVKFLTVGDPHPDGTRQVFFELNGQPREVVVVDRALSAGGHAHPKADPNNEDHVGAPMPGLVV